MIAQRLDKVNQSANHAAGSAAGLGTPFCRRLAGTAQARGKRDRPRARLHQAKEKAGAGGKDGAAPKAPVVARKVSTGPRLTALPPSCRRCRAELDAME